MVFATVWCAVCAQEAPAVERWAKANPDYRVTYVISGSNPARVAAFVQQRGLDRNVLEIRADPDGAVADAHGVQSTPTLLLTDANGVLQSRHTRIDQLVQPVADSGRELGTSYDLVVYVPGAEEGRARAALATARTECRRLEALLSEWRDDSLVSRINRTASTTSVPVPPMLRRLLEASLHVSRVTDSAFDITWPSLAGSARDVVVNDGGIRFGDPQTRIGLGGVAKGLVVDALFAVLRRAGFGDVVVNIGGDLRTSGGARRLRIADPFAKGRVAAHLVVRDTAVASSGNYLRPNHIVDPRTGSPPAFGGSVTVLTRDAAMADALATALFVMGPQKGLAFAKATAGVEAVFVTRQGVLSSPGVRPIVHPAQLSLIDVGVDLGGHDVGVTQEYLHDSQVRSAEQ